MKTGKSLTELAAEIERQQNAKKDFVAPTTKIDLVTQGKEVKLHLGHDAPYAINELAHGQIAEHAGIPKPYYEKMREQEPELLGANIRAWFDRYPKNRLVRVLDDRNRAFLSDSYRPLENYDLSAAVLPTLLENNLEIMSCEITERKLYIKAVDPKILADVPKGRKFGDGVHAFFDTCSPAIIISNSEVGAGRLTVDSGIYTSACTNMALISKGGMKRTHIGARANKSLAESVDNIEHLLSSEARKATDKAVWLQVRDVVKGSFDRAVFDSRIEQLKGLVADKIDDVVRTVELSAKKFGLSDLVAKQVRDHLIEDGDLTRYGLFNAITRSAQDQDSYDDATDLEALGGRIIELAPSEWRELQAA